jgi:phage gpG-like protein
MVIINLMARIVAALTLLVAAEGDSYTGLFVLLPDRTACETDGLVYVETEEECELAASATHLGLADTGAFVVGADATYAAISPFGCYYKTDPAAADTQRLYLNVAGSTEGTERAGYRAVCKNPNYVSTTPEPTTPVYNAEFGAHGYIEYRRGTLPLILVASHGGKLEPDSIPERTEGQGRVDLNTKEFMLMVADKIEVLVPVQVLDGERATPHVIISHLARSRMDGNRDFDLASQGSTEAEVAWAELHTFLLRAQATVAADYGKGLQVDFHGQSHPEEWIELGFGVGGSSLDDQPLGPTATWTTTTAEERNTIAGLWKRQSAINSTLNFDALLRGSESFGGFLADELSQTDLVATRVLPSPANKGPAGSESYFSGGLITESAVKGAHALAADSLGKLDEQLRPPPYTLDGIQIELPFNLRGNDADSAISANAIGTALHRFFGRWYDGLDVRELGKQWPTAPPPTQAPPTYTGLFVLLPDRAACETDGLVYVETEEECELAASATHLGLADTGAFAVGADATYAAISPFGCYYKTDPAAADTQRLYLNVAGSTEGTERAGYRAVCKNPNYGSCEGVCGVRRGRRQVEAVALDRRQV